MGDFNLDLLNTDLHSARNELGKRFFQKPAENLLRISTLSEGANEFLTLPNTTDKLFLKKYLHVIALLYTVLTIFTFNKMLITLFSSIDK